MANVLIRSAKFSKTVEDCWLLLANKGLDEDDLFSQPDDQFELKILSILCNISSALIVLKFGLIRMKKEYKIIKEVGYVELGYWRKPNSSRTPLSGRQKLCINGMKPALGKGHALK